MSYRYPAGRTGHRRAAPKALKSLGLAFRDGIVDGLRNASWASARSSGSPHRGAWQS